MTLVKSGVTILGCRDTGQKKKTYFLFIHTNLGYLFGGCCVFFEKYGGIMMKYVYTYINISYIYGIKYCMYCDMMFEV